MYTRIVNTGESKIATKTPTLGTNFALGERFASVVDVCHTSCQNEWAAAKYTHTRARAKTAG